MSVNRALLQVLLTVLLQRALEIAADCPPGFLDVSGMCLRQTHTCPPEHILLNGICHPVTSSQSPCPEGQVSVSNQCCTRDCLRSCQSDQLCTCCGQVPLPVPAPSAPCPNQPVAPCGSWAPVAPFPLPPSYPYPTPGSRPPLSTTEPPPPAHRPEPVRPLCPAGTVEVEGECRAVYCGRGTLVDGWQCSVVECPDGTFWTGTRCSPPEPATHSIAFNRTVVAHFSRPPIDVVANNLVNNVDVNITLKAPSSRGEEEGDGVEDSSGEVATCCTVMTPRICRRSSSGDRWNCYSRRYRRCGRFCIAATIYLRPPRPRQLSTSLVMPPDPEFTRCRLAGLCPDSDDFHDCSGCESEDLAACSSYCYRYPCSGRSCKYYDQQEYCQQWPGVYGCRERDGCYEDWCSGGATGRRQTVGCRLRPVLSVRTCGTKCQRSQSDGAGREQ